MSEGTEVAERRIAISNIAWSGEDNERFFDLVAAEGARGVELAASLLWKEPIDSSEHQRRELRRSVEDRGLVITGLHSLLFARPELQLLADGDGARQVADYLRRTVDLCAELGGAYLVMGGSKNRLRGALRVEEAWARGARVLRDLGEYANSRGCYFTLEALPAPGCDFVTSIEECARMVALAGTAGLRVHFDTGAASVTEADTDDARLAGLLGKAALCQANDFELLPPGSRQPETHGRWARLLDAAGYRGWMSIEMRRTGDPAETISRAIRFVRETYIH
jgi:D-psicose/D-tagatose/L-ribulose 3-epimerase